MREFIIIDIVIVEIVECIHNVINIDHDVDVVIVASVINDNKIMNDDNVDNDATKMSASQDSQWL